MTRSMWLFRFALPEGQTLAPPGARWEVERHVAQLTGRSMSVEGPRAVPEWVYIHTHIYIISLFSAYIYIYINDMWPSSVKGSVMVYFLFSEFSNDW